MSTPLENLPEIRSFAETSDEAGSIRLNGGMYFPLPEGVSTISVSMKTGNATVYLATSASSGGRFWSTAVETGESRVIPGVAVPKGAERFLNIRTNGGPHDVGVTIITYPL